MLLSLLSLLPLLSLPALLWLLPPLALGLVGGFPGELIVPQKDFVLLLNDCGLGSLSADWKDRDLYMSVLAYIGCARQYVQHTHIHLGAAMKRNVHVYMYIYIYVAYQHEPTDPIQGNFWTRPFLCL